MIKKLKPRQPDPYIKTARDQETAKFGHLNWLIGQINAIPIGSGVQSVVAGGNIIVDNTDPYNPIVSSFLSNMNFFYQGQYNPTGTSLYPTQADTKASNPVSEGMFWVVDTNGTINGNAVTVGDAVFALIDNAPNNIDADWTILAGLFAGVTQNIEDVLLVGDDANSQSINNLTYVGINKVATYNLDVIGNVLVSNDFYPTGLFEVGTNSIIIGDKAFAYQGAYIEVDDNAVGNSAALTFMALFGGAGNALLVAQDFIVQSALSITNPIASFSSTLAGNTFDTDMNILFNDKVGFFGHNDTPFTEGLSLDMTGGTGSGVYALGNKGGTRLVIDDIAGTTTIIGLGIKTSVGTLAAAGIWKLGKPAIGFVALDTSSFVEVEIDGSIVKLGVVS